MPIQPTYPGVYLEEIKNTSRTISGTSTSITAFIGSAKRGPVNEPVRVQSFGEFERIFGGLCQKSTMSYAVQHYFLNGGGDAIINRIHNSAAESTVDLITDDLILKAVNPGAWGNKITAAVDHNVSEEAALSYGLAEEDLFNLTLTDEGTGAIEEFRNLTVKDSPRKIDELLESSSKLLRVDTLGDDLTSIPAAHEPKKAKLTLDTDNDSLRLEAKKEGAWGNDLSVTIDHQGAGEFQLILYLDTVEKENFSNLTVAAGEKRIDTYLEANSEYIRVPEGSSLPDNDEIPVEILYTADAAKFENGSDACAIAEGGSDGVDLAVEHYTGSEAEKTGIYAFDKADIFNMMCIPPISSITDVLYSGDILAKAMGYCKKRRAMLIMDPPSEWSSAKNAVDGLATLGTPEENAAVFFPKLLMPDPLQENRITEFAPCGAVAGAFARTDTDRGIWKAPAGVNVTLKGVQGLSVKLTDGEHGQLNPLGINCLRSFPVIGSVIYGSRTRKGADILASEFKYIPVRRLTLHIEESLYRGSQFAVFEPNDEPLWADLRFAATSFMQDLYRKGAFQGSSPSEAYFVKCDSETTIQDDIDRGIVNIMVGFAPLKPAEFVILKIQQIAGQGA